MRGRGFFQRRVCVPEPSEDHSFPFATNLPQRTVLRDRSHIRTSNERLHLKVSKACAVFAVGSRRVFRNALAFICLALSVSPCLAQSLRNEGEYSRTEAAPETDNSPSMRTRPRSASMPECRISIARLRVPGKA